MQSEKQTESPILIGGEIKAGGGVDKVDFSDLSSGIKFKVTADDVGEHEEILRGHERRQSSERNDQ